MITTIQEIETALNISACLTEAENSALQDIHPRAEAAVINHLGYNPEFGAYTEYYPRRDLRRQARSALETVRGGRAVIQTTGRRAMTRLQLRQLPLRVVSSVKINRDGKFQSSRFTSITALTAGDDYWVPWDDNGNGICLTGILHSDLPWPLEPGSVEVTYQAGYNPDEFAGTTAPQLGAIKIKEAIILTAVRAMHTFTALAKKQTAGLTVGFTGPLTGERLQDYSYTVASGAAGAQKTLSGLIPISIPAEAQAAIQRFVSYGRAWH